MSKVVARFFLLLMLPLSAASQSLNPVAKQEWKTIDDYSVESLIHAHATGAVILSGNCQPVGDGKAVFSGFIHHPPANPPASLDGELDFLTSVQPHITWSLQEDGLVRIVDSRVSGQILKRTVRRIEIIDAADIQNAVDQALSVPEVVSYFSQSQTQLVRNSSANRIFGAVVNGKSSTPSSTPKHSLLLENVSLEEALDRIAHDFAGAWVYCECPGRISIDSYQTGIPKFWSQAGDTGLHK
jgi:hypothetical protein